MSKATLDDGPAVAPEVKELFPSVSSIGISSTVLTNPATLDNDTTAVALIKVKHNLKKEERKKLSEYLQARLNISRITIVEM